MKLVRRITSLALVGAMTFTMTGCNPLAVAINAPLVIVIVIARALSSNAPAKKKRVKKVRLKDKADVAINGSVGGLSGDFDLDIGDYGTLEDVADIKGSFKANIKDKEFDESTASVIEAAVLDRLGVEIDVTSTNRIYKGRQTRGGVKKIFKGKVKFEGVVVSGDDAGSTVTGSMSAKGKFK